MRRGTRLTGCVVLLTKVGAHSNERLDHLVSDLFSVFLRLCVPPPLAVIHPRLKLLQPEPGGCLLRLQRAATHLRVPPVKPQYDVTQLACTVTPSHHTPHARGLVCTVRASYQMEQGRVEMSAPRCGGDRDQGCAVRVRLRHGSDVAVCDNQSMLQGDRVEGEFAPTSFHSRHTEVVITSHFMSGPVNALHPRPSSWRSNSTPSHSGLRSSAACRGVSRREGRARLKDAPHQASRQRRDACAG